MKKCKVTLNELKALEEYLPICDELHLPIATSYKFAKFLDLVKRELIILEEERRKLVKKYGTSDENEQVKVPEDKYEEFFKEFQELLSQEVTLEYNPISINEFGSDVELPAKVVSRLLVFIDD